MTIKTILATSIMSLVMFMATFASGSLGGILQESFADPVQACPDGTTLNPDTGQCESAATCSSGTLNPATGLCEVITTSAPTSCSSGTLNPATGLCETPPVNGKITLCHVAGKNGKTVEISVNINALEGHLQHGDTIGPCP